MTFDEMKAKYLQEMGNYKPMVTVRGVEKKEEEPVVAAVEEVATAEPFAEEATQVSAIIDEAASAMEAVEEPVSVMENIDEPAAIETLAQAENEQTPEVNLPLAMGQGKTGDDFSTYTETGYIRVVVYAANQAIPIANAAVTISKYDGAKPLIMIDTKTDETGSTPVVSLPAPPRELSQQPQKEIPPYGVYNVVVNLENFKSVPIFNVPVFSGVVSIQPVEVNPIALEKKETSVDEMPSYDL